MDENTSKCEYLNTSISRRVLMDLLVVVFGPTDVRLVLLHRVELDLADGAGVALQRGGCSQQHKRRTSGPPGTTGGRGGGGGCVLTWGRGRAVRLHQLHLGHLFPVLLADVVLLGHERVVERRLAHGAEAVGVPVVAVAARRAAGILCWFLPRLRCCWGLKGCWTPPPT